MLELSFDVDAQPEGEAALHIAAESGDIDGVLMPIQHGATIDLHDTAGRTPLARPSHAPRARGARGVEPADLDPAPDEYSRAAARLRHAGGGLDADALRGRDRRVVRARRLTVPVPGRAGDPD